MEDNAAYLLLLLSEYTHTLDSLPIDLSRNFADLRELDAVLSSSVSSITAKITSLTAMIQEGRASKEDRLWLLTDIAEEAQRLKLGGEDKIRVACQAADNLKAHGAHLRALAGCLPGFNPALLNRTTVYPHVSERSYMPTATMESGRRRRGVLGSIMTNPDPSPAKRKRAPRDDDADAGGTYRTPKKPAGADGHPRARPNARAKKVVERPASPADSLVSVTSHLPAQNHARHGSSATHARPPASAAPGNPKRRAGGGANAHRNPTPLAHEAYPAHDAPHNAPRRGGNDAYNGPPASAHPSLPPPFPNAPHAPAAYDAHGLPLQDWGIPHAAQLEGPGMPVARSASIHSTATAAPVTAAAAAAAAAQAADAGGDGENDNDNDDRTYCFCDGVSYGEMIACDDARCEREWFHLACIGLTVPPDGTWFCEACKNKKPVKRAVRGGKRRSATTKA
ncbi:hypothetical protein HYPSUDRAFT_34031 [Hypholoma sublateritium FD-334 SS-4]|uniref:Chromatin modification-related protein n=1 Tax=Hypholoma sublateritium (strain FD-334 SS-4) TaxID=945553 RepID=A0A0D2LL46_HYPSF|nr:hypothetical protein HYPSUDRAFT_34031 [Hypholoma sublateritium FD-334 SS-4]